MLFRWSDYRGIPLDEDPSCHLPDDKTHSTTGPFLETARCNLKELKHRHPPRAFKRTGPLLIYVLKGYSECNDFGGFFARFQLRGGCWATLPRWWVSSAVLSTECCRLEPPRASSISFMAGGLFGCIGTYYQVADAANEQRANAGVSFRSTF